QEAKAAAGGEPEPPCHAPARDCRVRRSPLLGIQARTERPNRCGNRGTGQRLAPAGDRAHAKRRAHHAGSPAPCRAVDEDRTRLGGSMRLLTFSDIHGDLRALGTVMEIEADYYFAAG